MCKFSDWFKRKPQTPADFELPSPKPRLTFDDIEQLPDGRFAVRFPFGTVMSTVVDTNSLDPTVDAGMIIFLTPMQDVSDLIVGDIVVYEHPRMAAIHRIHEIGQDEQGWWCKTRASNPLVTWDDPVLLRAENIKYLHRGELY